MSMIGFILGYGYHHLLSSTSPKLHVVGSVTGIARTSYWIPILEALFTLTSTACSIR